MLSRLIGENITVRFNPSITPPLLEADAGMIEQTLMNLCVNARDAMPEGGALTISIDSIQIDTERIRGHMKIQPGKFVRLSVADTGCGMDEAMLGHIFEPFYTTKEFGKGTGLGLATVYGIVSQHKGWVEVESAIGKGSTFKLFFPATSKERPPRANDRKPPASPGSATILYVEDELSLRRLVSKSLRQLGYRVLEASDGVEALKTWEEHDGGIDLLFSDMLMPGGMTGLNLSAILRKEKPGLKVIISSGYTAETTTPPQLSGEEIVYFNKPFEFEDLTKTIQDCLASR
jgi:CheY-like chemotaxis protein